MSTVESRVKRVSYRVWEVEGDGDVYTVYVGRNGEWRCTCLGFVFNKRCKHIGMVIVNMGGERGVC